MELASNVIWLLLTLAAFGLRLAQSVHIRPGRRSKHIRMLIGAVAVGCAVTFLFPVISLTDHFRCDQPSAAKLSDLDISTSKWRPLRHQQARWSPPFVAMVCGFSFASLDAFQAVVDRPVALVTIHTLLEPHQGRSPPINSALT